MKIPYKRRIHNESRQKVRPVQKRKVKEMVSQGYKVGITRRDGYIEIIKRAQVRWISPLGVVI